MNETAESGPASRWVAAQLQAFEASYRTTVRPGVDGAFGIGTSRAFGRLLRYLTEPVVWTLDQRESFFRSGFALAAADASRSAAVGPLLGATVELGWSCALVVDDLIDGGNLRDNHRCAHSEYGRVRTLVAAGSTLALMVPVLTVRMPLTWHRRGQLVRWGLLATGQALASAVPRRRWTLASYSKVGGYSNSAALWAIVAPVAGDVPDDVLRELYSCAALMCANGKLRNDLLDYTGGSTDHGDELADFASRRVTFPVLLCLEQVMDPVDRESLEAHFNLRPGAPMSLAEGIDLLERYRTFERSAEHLVANGEEAARRIRRLRARWPEGQPLLDLLHDWALAWPQAAVEQLALLPDRDAPGQDWE
ncbi:MULTISPECIES: polyprenyl synthetase family protein [unclassified Nocardioides]|uniref:polyprenyl synthetase family protein n=1 Tax=unclassified Nocardioides TaxID=2615069 RepID=UPI0007039733|nr:MULTISPECIES: polyprenyl synthetase family protein [unclassified Nocardioides]KRC54063.1 hypothetical protein ASE19_08345 [Nocardioides sp. Root79]KRC71399.1 hypothetical protein ASE20_10760 [Nocardioides sp. Root240]